MGHAEDGGMDTCRIGTIEDFRPRHLRVVGARDLGLDLEEEALLQQLLSRLVALEDDDRPLVAHRRPV